MNREENSKEQRVIRQYYDIVGLWGLPLVHMGGLAATEELLEMCQLDENSEVLDVGCGTGFTACRIATHYGSRVVGVDISEKMVTSAKKRTKKEDLKEKVEFRVVDASKLPFNDDSFDVVIMESVLNILPSDKITQVLSEVSRATRLHGRVGINEVYRDKSTPPELLERINKLLKDSLGPGGNLARYTPEEMKKWLKDTQLKVIKMTKKPTTTSSNLASDLIKVMGWGGFIRYSFRALGDMVTNSQLWETAKKARPVKKIIERDENTKKFFGYALIIAQKIEQ
jgi:ubiquinone/menaquinone biosynthesis C-methylase UbiE